MTGTRRSPWLLAVLWLAGCHSFVARPLDPAHEAAAFEARSLASPEVSTRVEGLLGTATPPARWDAAALTAAALGFRPDIAIARAGAERATAAVTSAGARPNPTLSLAPEISSNAPAATSPWGPMLSIAWPIETAGKRGHRIDRARAAELSAHYALLSEVVRTHAEIAHALLARAAAAASVTSLEQQLAASRSLAEQWRSRVAAGAASRVEAAPLEAAVLEGERALGAARRTANEATTALAGAVGIPGREIETAPLRAPDVEELAPWMELERRAAVERALLSRSDVLAALADYAAAEAALALEVAKQFPDLVIGPGYQFDQGQNKWQIGISLELPLVNRNEGPIAEAEAARSEAAARFDAAQAAAVVQIESALASRDGLAAERDALRGLAKERREGAARAEHALAQGAASRTDLLAADLDALRAEQAADEADAAWRGALLDLGAALDALPFPVERLEAWIGQEGAS